MQFDVFISYSHEDKAAADSACATLEQAGIRCWISPRDIVPGMDWSELIINAIERAKLMVLIFSGHANESPQIKREVERAVHMGLPIIPVRIEDTPPSKSLEYFISTPHWLDAFTPPLEERLKQLAAAAGALLSATPTGEIGVKKVPPAHGLMGAVAKVKEAQRTVWPLGFAVAAALVAGISAALAAMTGRIQAQPAWMIIGAAA